MASLGRVAWLRLWERAVDAVAARIGEAANRRLREAAAESRYPQRRLRRLLLTPGDVRAIAARLGSGGAPFVAALDALEQTVHAASGAQAALPGGRTSGGLRSKLPPAGSSRRGRRMAATAGVEEQLWRQEAESLRAWRRPVWPVWLITVVVAAAAAYVGLVVGGYLPVPATLQPLTDFWWSRL